MGCERDPDGELWAAICETRVIRMLHDILWTQVDQLPDEVPAGTASGRRWRPSATGSTRSKRRRPVPACWHDTTWSSRSLSLASPPPAEAMAEITAAIATLDRHGLIVADIA